MKIENLYVDIHDWLKLQLKKRDDRLTPLGKGHACYKTDIPFPRALARFYEVKKNHHQAT